MGGKRESEGEGERMGRGGDGERGRGRERGRGWRWREREREGEGERKEGEEVEKYILRDIDRGSMAGCWVHRHCWLLHLQHKQWNMRHYWHSCQGSRLPMATSTLNLQSIYTLYIYMYILGLQLPMEHCCYGNTRHPLPQHARGDYRLPLCRHHTLSV